MDFSTVRNSAGEMDWALPSCPASFWKAFLAALASCGGSHSLHSPPQIHELEIRRRKKKNLLEEAFLVVELSEHLIHLWSLHRLCSVYVCVWYRAHGAY